MPFVPLKVLDMQHLHSARLCSKKKRREYNVQSEPGMISMKKLRFSCCAGAKL